MSTVEDARRRAVLGMGFDGPADAAAPAGDESMPRRRATHLPPGTS